MYQKLTLVALEVVVSIAALTYGEGIMEKEGHKYEHVERTGHFRDEPFISLYEAYANVLIQRENKSIEFDDSRLYSPSGNDCKLYLDGFRLYNYQLRGLEEFVKLDACLGYLFSEQQRHAEDKDENVMAPYKKDPKLSSLYSGTSIESVSSESKECVANLILGVILLKNEIGDKCHSDRLQLYAQFADCQKVIPKELRTEDSYLKTIYDFIQMQTQECLKAEIGYLNRAVRTTYAQSYTTRIMNAVMKYLSKKHKQQAKRMWPSQIIKLLNAIEYGDKEDQINLRDVHKLLRGVYQNHPGLTNRFLGNLGLYATKRNSDLEKERKDDANGNIRYTELVVNDLCNFFRSSEHQKFDFATSLIRLINLVNHPDVFGISVEQFIIKALSEGHEFIPLYFSVSACNILTFTDGFIEKTVANGTPKYKVVFKPDTKDMVRWPDSGYY